MRKFLTAVRLALLPGVLILAACGNAGPDENVIELSGPTMGTRYSVQVAGSPMNAMRERLAGDISAELRLINSLMSTYDPESELSRFNVFNGSAWFSVSDRTAEVVRQASVISDRTGGAFDVTVGPLVNLWGFGPEPEPDSLPSPESIVAAITRVGYSMVEVRDDPPALRKTRPDVYVDLSAIAKGYAVDCIAALLEQNGITDYLVDIGGEIRVSGHNGSGQAWRLAIEFPQPGQRTPLKVIELSRSAVATSGNYRNFFEIDGRRYAHSIDPRTGWPVSHALLAVTVVAEDAMTADAWATALMVLGPEEGLALAGREGLSALLLSDDGGKVREHLTAGMELLIKGQESN